MCPICAGVGLVELPERFGTVRPLELLKSHEKPYPSKKLDASQERKRFVEDGSGEQVEEDGGGKGWAVRD